MAKNVTSADIFEGMFQNIPAYETRENTRKSEEKEQKDTSPVIMMKRSCLHDFSSFYGHPYRVVEDDKMLELAESIRDVGILEPLQVRPDKENPGKYEIIAGHRRNYAAGLAGLDEVPVYIKDIDDNAAAVIMVDSNNRREMLLPSEKAWAYRTKAEALRRQGKRTDLLPGEEQDTGGGGMHSVGEKNGDGVRTVQRYIRLTYLIPELLELVDKENLPIVSGYLLSFFEKEEQGYVLAYYEKHQLLPDKSQLTAMGALREQGMLDAAAVDRIMSKREKTEKPLKKKTGVTLKNSCLRQYFPREATADYMEKIILELLEEWAKKEQSMSREEQQLRGQMDIEDYPGIVPN